MIDKEKIIKWKKSIEHIKGLYGYVTESDDLLLQFCEQYLSGKLVEPVKNKINKISKIEQYRNELLNELEKVMRYKGKAGDIIPVEDVSEFDEKEVKGYIRGYNDCIDKIRQKISEMRGGK